MKKHIIIYGLAVSVVSLVLVFMVSSTARAQTACPVGFVCTPKCPISYICTPTNTSNSTTVTNVSNPSILSTAVSSGSTINGSVLPAGTYIPGFGTTGASTGLSGNSAISGTSGLTSYTATAQSQSIGTTAAVASPSGSATSYTAPTVPVPTAAATAALMATLNASNVTQVFGQSDDILKDVQTIFYPPNTIINYQYTASRSDLEWSGTGATFVDPASGNVNPDSYCHRPIPNKFAIALYHSLTNLGINASYLVSDATRYVIPVNSEALEAGAISQRIYVAQGKVDNKIGNYPVPIFARCLDVGFVSNYPTYITNYTAFVNSHVLPPAHIYTFGEYIGAGGAVMPAPTI